MVGTRKRKAATVKTVKPKPSSACISKEAKMAAVRKSPKKPAKSSYDDSKKRKSTVIEDRNDKSKTSLTVVVPVEGTPKKKRLKVNPSPYESDEESVVQFNQKMTRAHITEDDNFVEFAVTDEGKFLSESEQEAELQQQSSDDESSAEEDANELQLTISINNNATVDARPGCSYDTKGDDEDEVYEGFKRKKEPRRSRSRSVTREQQPDSPAKEMESRPSLTQAFSMVQDFMLHKGIIEDELVEEDMEEFLEGVKGWEGSVQRLKEKASKVKGKSVQENKATNRSKQQGQEKSRGNDLNTRKASDSETTVY